MEKIIQEFWLFKLLNNIFIWYQEFVWSTKLIYKKMDDNSFAAFQLG